MLGSYSMAAQLTASRVALGSIELVATAVHQRFCLVVVPVKELKNGNFFPFERGEGDY
jgi:hypothetical protein